LALDARWRDATQTAETLRSEQKTASEAIAQGKAQGHQIEAELRRMKSLLAEVKTAVRQAEVAQEALQAVLVTLPNLPDPGAAEPENEVLRVVGDASKTGRDHLELAGERIDMERGARLSGWRFSYLRGDLALLELALVPCA